MGLNLWQTVKSLVMRNATEAFDEAEFEQDSMLELDDDVRTVIITAMEHAKGFSPKVIASWALGGVLALSVITSAFCWWFTRNASQCPRTTFASSGCPGSS